MKKTLLVLALVAGFTSLALNTQAELITINIGPTGFNIGGINGGVANGSSSVVSSFPISGNDMNIFNKVQFSGTFTGLSSRTGITFAAGGRSATPVNFALNESIGSGSAYAANLNSFFQVGPSLSPDFGAGSYMGFQTAQGNYGWLEVTWTATVSSGQFQILSGAYQSTPNVAILAGAGPTAPIPEPGTWAAMAIFAGGAAFAGWRRRNSAKVAA